MKKIIDSRTNSVKEIALALLDYAETFSFVVREGKDLSKEAGDLFEGLKPYLMETKIVTEWAGTKLFWEKATLYIYHLNSETAYLLYSKENNLFSWILPQLPEDLVFYKNNEPFFVSITHEKDAYFELDDNEEAQLRNRSLI